MSFAIAAANFSRSKCALFLKKDFVRYFSVLSRKFSVWRWIPSARSMRSLIFPRLGCHLKIDQEHAFILTSHTHMVSNFVIEHKQW